MKTGPNMYSQAGVARKQPAAKKKNISIHQHREDVLSESDSKNRRLIEGLNDTVYRMTVPDGNYEYISSSAEDVFGHPRDNIVNHPHFLKHVLHPSARRDFKQQWQEWRKGNVPETYEYKIIDAKGNERWILQSNKAVQDAVGKITAIEGLCRNVTKQKLAETYREIGREILQSLNEPHDLRTSIQRVLAICKMRTGVDAVGIRLQDGDDFPYFALEGFSPDFLLTENTLLAQGTDGGLCRDENGNIQLECTCGLILSGKTDPSSSLFTQGGSFWTNDAYPLLELPADQDPRLHPRNNCIHQGYASVALIPIRCKEQIVGLLQLNDKRKGRFSLATIEMLEDIATHIGSALMRKRMERELTRTHKARRALIKRLEQAREEERTRISQDLHDDLGQNLTAIKMDLRWIERAIQDNTGKIDISAIRTRATAAIEMTDTMVATVQELAASLRPGVLDRLGVGPAIRFEGRRFQTRTGIRCTVNLEDTVPDIPETTATALFRIFQECLTNIARHSHATLASAHLGTKAGNIILRIHDNGKGISQQEIDHPESLGLLGMKERAVDVGGSILLRRGKRRGTLVTIKLPLKQTTSQQP